MRCFLAHLIKRLKKNPNTGKTQDYYLIARRVNGREKAMSLGFLSKKQAEAALALFEADLEAGHDPIQTETASLPDSPSSKNPTLREWWGDIAQPWPAWPPCRMLAWLDAKGAALKTRRTYDDSRRAIVSLLGDCKINALTASHGDTFVASLRRMGYSARTIQIRVDHLRRSLQLAQEDGLIQTPPRLLRPASEKAEACFHTPEETQKLLQVLAQRVAAQRRNGLSYLAVLLAVTCGLRPGEVCTRRWSDLDWRSGLLKIGPVTLPDGNLWKPKAGSNRSLPLPPPLLSLLKTHWQVSQTQWIFPNRDDASQPMVTFKKALAGACKAAGLPILHPHTLRHTAATRWAWDGVDVPTMMKLGGWKTPAIPLTIYAQTNQERVADALLRSAPAIPADQHPLTQHPVLVSGPSKNRGLK